jgi:hypothetical protein
MGEHHDLATTRQMVKLGMVKFYYDAQRSGGLRLVTEHENQEMIQTERIYGRSPTFFGSLGIGRQFFLNNVTPTIICYKQMKKKTSN